MLNGVFYSYKNGSKLLKIHSVCFALNKSYTPFMVYVSKQIVLFFYYFTRVYKKYIPKENVQTIGWYWVPLVFDFLLNVVFIIFIKSFNEINLKKKPFTISFWRNFERLFKCNRIFFQSLLN